MFKISGDSSKFIFKIFEDKFKDGSIIRLDIVIQDDDINNVNSEEFERILNQLKEDIEGEGNNYNMYKLLLKIFKSEEFILSKNNINISPIKAFPKFNVTRELSDGKIEYNGVKNISWDTFVHFSNVISHAKK